MGMREREAKFEVPTTADIGDAGKLLDGLADVAVEEVDQEAVYFDTSDLRLTRAGASLRHRSDDGWTVKLPIASGALMVRHELGFSADDDDAPLDPPRAAQDVVRAWTRLSPLLPVATIRTHRRRIEVFDKAGDRVGELDDDAVSSAGDGTAQFHEVEFEIDDHADPHLVKQVLKRLRTSGARPDRAGTPKVARVLGDRAAAPPDLPEPERLAQSAKTLALLRSTIAAGTWRLVTHDPAVRLGDGPEAIHQARVATRRLRSDLRTLR